MTLATHVKTGDNWNVSHTNELMTFPNCARLVLIGTTTGRTVDSAEQPDKHENPPHNSRFDISSGSTYV